MAQYSTILLDVQDNLAVLTLNRPEKLNALSLDMRQEILSALRTIGQTPDIRCLLLTGAGKAFCSGADLTDAATSGQPHDAGASLMETYNPIMQELSTLKIPVVSAVNGAAAGAGMSLAIAADIVIASETAYFPQAFVNIGLVPDAGSTYILPRLIGAARARAMMMLGEKLSAQTAAEWGLVYKLVSENNLLPTATRYAQKLAKGPTVALSGIRSLLAASATNSFSEQLHAEAQAQRTASQTEDCAQGVTAFLQKRPPEFSGR